MTSVTAVTGVSLKPNQLFQEGKAASGIDATNVLLFTRGVKNSTITLKVTEETFGKNTSWKGAVVAAGHNFQVRKGALKTSIAYDIGANAFTGTALHTLKSGAKQLDSGVTYKQAGNELTFSLAAKPNRPLRLAAAIVPKKGTKTFGLTLEKGGWTVAPVVELPKKAVTINVAKNVKGSTVQVSYALQTEIATLSYTKKPYKVVAKTPVGRSGLGWPTLTVEVLDFAI